jgi:AAA domain
MKTPDHNNPRHYEAGASLPSGREMTPLERARQRLGLTPSNELISWMKENPRSWLVEGVIAEGTVGVLGASAKSGKTWSALDLAVAVATGGKWLGRFPVSKQGPVIIYPGESGGAPFAQRLEAVQYAVNVDQVTNVFCSENIPNISNLIDLAVIREQVRLIKPVLVILDSVYLAIPEVDTKNIASVGAALYPLQQICSEVGAALMLTHHWNEKGTGNGADRFSGAGWNAWGRFLISMRASRNHASEGRSEVDLDFILTGSEVSEQEWRLRRTVHRVNPKDINSPLVYALGNAPPPAPRASKPNATNRVERSIRDLGRACTLIEIMHRENENCKMHTPNETPLTEDTVRRRLRDLVKSGQLKKTTADTLEKYEIVPLMDEDLADSTSFF